MKKETPSSSQVSEIEYLEDRQILAVTFKKGTVYHYYNVPKETADQAFQAESIGNFLNSCIKNVYSYNKIG